MSSHFDEVFTYDEIKKEYKNDKTKCNVDSDCKGPLNCLSDNRCRLTFHCLENDLSRCYIYHNDTNSDKYNDDCSSNDDCLSNSCSNNKCDGRLLWCTVGDGSSKCGLDYLAKCTKDSECYEENCKDGICIQNNYLEKNINKATAIFFSVVGVLVVLLIIFCVYRRRRNNK